MNKNTHNVRAYRKREAAKVARMRAALAEIAAHSQCALAEWHAKDALAYTGD